MGLGIPRITDFGLARDLSARQRLTETGSFMGTPCYMAPEQVRKEHGGPAVDVHALGAILYEMLTGRPPFEGATSAETIHRLLHEEPLSPLRLRPQLSADLATLCLKCLEKSPRRRYASAGELAEDLRRFQEGKPIGARPVGVLGRTHRWCLRRPLVAGLLALCALLGAGLLTMVLLYEARLAARVEDEQRQIVQLNILIGTEKLEAGDALLAVLRFAEALRLEESPEHAREDRAKIASALRQCPELEQLRIRDERVLCVATGSAQLWVASITRDGSVLVWDAWTGGQQGRTLHPEETSVGGALSSDGRYLATITTAGTVRVWDVTTGQGRKLPDDHKAAVQWRSFTPDGRSLLTQHNDHTVRVWGLTDGAFVARSSVRGEGVVFSSVSDDSHWLFTANTAGTVEIHDLEAGKRLGSPVSMWQGVRVAAFSPDGRRLVAAGADGRVGVWDVNASAWLPGPGTPRYAVSRIWFSPDGERVLLAAEERGCRIWSLQTSEMLDLPLTDAGTVTSARFSSDGRLVVVGTDNGARVWNARNGQPITPLLRHGAPGAAAALDGNGRRLVTVSREGTACVWGLAKSPQPQGGATAEDLVKLAQLLSNTRINEQQTPERLEPGALRDLWNGLHREP